MNEDRYEGRLSNRELNRALYDIVSNFVSQIEDNLGELDYKMQIVGSLASGQAVHMEGDRWCVRDIDFKLTKKGGPLTPAEAMALYKSSWFNFLVKGFLRELGAFYSENNIKNTCNEADFIYDDTNWTPNTFSIGVNS